MSAYQIVDNPQLGFNGAGGAASQTSSAAVVPVGYRALGYDTSLGVGEFVYCQNSDVASRGQFVQIQNGSACLLAAGDSAKPYQIGVVAAAWTTTGTAQYGWVQVKGVADYARGTNSSFAAGQQGYICAGTAGYVVTNVVAGNRIQGLVLPASYTSSQSASMTVNLCYPFCAGLTASL